MTLRHMKIYLEVYLQKSMTAAAKNLYMTQPSVSQAVKELEEYYDTRFFDRINGKLYVTEAGEELYYYAEHIISLFKETEEAVTGGASFSRLRIGGNYTMGINMLHSFVTRLETLCPGVGTTVFVNKSARLKEMLRNGSLDLALVESAVREPDNDMVQEVFHHDRNVLVVSPRHRLAGTEHIPLSALSKERLLVREQGVGSREMFETVMENAGFPIPVYWESISVTALINVVTLDSRTVAFLPYESVKALLAEKTLVELCIHGIDLNRELVIMYPKNKYVNPVMAMMIQICREHFKRQSEENTSPDCRLPSPPPTPEAAR